MRQYCPSMGIIAKRVWVMLTAGMLTAGATSLCAQGKPEYVQYREASAEAFEQQGKPPVEVGRASVVDGVLEAAVKVQPWTAENTLGFVIAAPAGDVTSASLIVEELFEDGAAARAPSVTGAGGTGDLGFQREQAVSVKHLGWIRGTRLLKMQVPAVVAGSFGKRLKSGTLRIAYRDIAAPEASVNAGTGTNSGSATEPFKRMISQLVANPAEVERFAMALDEVPGAWESAPVALGGFGDAVARFTTEGEGFVKFSGADLAAAGVNLAATAVNGMTVWCNGEQVAVHSLAAWEDPKQTVEAADEFLVYARDSDSTYTATRTYWVRVSEHPLEGLMPVMLAMPANRTGGTTASHFTASLLVEKDVPPVLTKNDQFLTILGFRWAWFTWTPSGNGGNVPLPRDYSTSGSVDFDLDGLAEGTDDALLDLSFYAHLWPKSAKPLPVRVTLNGETLGRLEITEPDALDHMLTAPARLLRSAGNSLVLSPETSSSAELSFDNLRIRYPRKYEMTSSVLEFYPPSAEGGAVELRLTNGATSAVVVADVSGKVPTIIGQKTTTETGIQSVNTKGPVERKYVAAATDSIPSVSLEKVAPKLDLRATSNTADLLVIAWPEFIEELAPWVDRKRGKGHAVRVVNVQDVYDQFGYGHLSPHAIREFIRYATLHWQGSAMGPAAGTVLLVGDSTSAYRNEFRNDVINYVPTMRLTDGADPFASDQWFVSIFGDDALADAIIGRFSVNSREDLRNLISKQLDYETKSAEGAWKNTLGFVADHTEFSESVDRVMRRAVPPRFFMDSIHMDELPWIDNYYFPKEIADAREAKVSPAATRRIRDLFNNGAAVVTYFGHGSPNIWSNERMWFGGDSPNSDNLLLTNRDRLPIVINMTCNSGAIDYPQPRWNICISEDFMRVENGGAVACFVPSGPGLTVQHERLMMEVGHSLFDREAEPLGQSMQVALWRYLAAGNPAELARMYIFLGDPLLMPHIARPMMQEEPTQSLSPEWAGTIALPGDVAGRQYGGAFQFTSYGDKVMPGSVSTFTSSTVALPVAARNESDAQTLAVSVSGRDTTSDTESTVVPLSNLGAIELVQWRRIDKAVDSSSTATVEFRIRNDAPVPLPGVQIELVDASGQSGDNGATILSKKLELAPFEESFVPLEVPARAGLSQFIVAVRDIKTRQELKPDVPVAVAGLRPDDARDAVPPAVVDPRSIQVKYRKSGETITASVSCQVYITAAEPLSNLRIGIEGPDGVVVQPSVITVPPVSPGEGTRISLSVPLADEGGRGDYKLRFDPSGFYPEFTRFPSQSVPLGASGFSDPQIESVMPSDASPTDGGTVFFNVTVFNGGRSTADGLKITGVRIVENGEEPLESKVGGHNPLFALKPGERKTMQLRWDPFANAGLNRLRFTVASIYDMPDSNPGNSEKALDLNVRTKARIRFVDVGPLALTAGDQSARQIRFAAKLKNEGETDVVGIRVMFHSDEPRTPENLLGEVDVDSVKAGETKTVTLTYKLKPGEEHKPFRLSCEALYKGSRQRVSVH